MTKNKLRMEKRSSRVGGGVRVFVLVFFLFFFPHFWPYCVLAESLT